MTRENLPVGVIGLGGMGGAIAQRLVKYAKTQSSRVYLWNRTASKAEAIAAAAPDTARVCDGPDDVARNSKVVFMVLLDGKQTQELLAGAVLPMAERGTIIVNCCTMDPKWGTEFADFCARRGCDYLSVPVFGRPDMAAAGKLVSVMAGPSAEAKKLVRPLLDAFSRAVMDLGDAPQAANAFKLAGNLVIANCIEMAAESMAIASAYKIPDAAVAQWAGLMFAGTPLAGYAQIVASGEFDPSKRDTPGCTVDVGLKDVGLMKELQSRHKLYLPSLDTVSKHLTEAKARGMGSQEWACFSSVVREKRSG